MFLGEHLSYNRGDADFAKTLRELKEPRERSSNGMIWLKKNRVEILNAPEVVTVILNNMAQYVSLPEASTTVDYHLGERAFIVELNGLTNTGEILASILRWYQLNGVGFFSAKDLAITAINKLRNYTET